MLHTLVNILQILASTLFSLFVPIPVVISSLSPVVTLISITWFSLLSQLFPLLLDCLALGFSCSTLAAFQLFELLSFLREIFIKR